MCSSKSVFLEFKTCYIILSAMKQVVRIFNIKILLCFIFLILNEKFENIMVMVNTQLSQTLKFLVVLINVLKADLLLNHSDQVMKLTVSLCYILMSDSQSAVLLGIHQISIPATLFVRKYAIWYKGWNVKYWFLLVSSKDS